MVRQENSVSPAENQGRVTAPECAILPATTAPIAKVTTTAMFEHFARQQLIRFLRHNAAMPVYEEIPSYELSCPLALGARGCNQIQD